MLEVNDIFRHVRLNNRNSFGLDCDYYKLDNGFGFKRYACPYNAAYSFYVQSVMSVVDVCPKVVGNLICDHKKRFYGFVTETVRWIPALFVDAMYPGEGKHFEYWETSRQIESLYHKELYGLKERARSHGFSAKDLHCRNFGFTSVGQLFIIDSGGFEFEGNNAGLLHSECFQDWYDSNFNPLKGKSYE